jgi:hypothetical protein
LLLETSKAYASARRRAWCEARGSIAERPATRISCACVTFPPRNQVYDGERQTGFLTPQLMGRAAESRSARDAPRMLHKS